MSSFSSLSSGSQCVRSQLERESICREPICHPCPLLLAGANVSGANLREPMCWEPICREPIDTEPGGCADFSQKKWIYEIWQGIILMFSRLEEVSKLLTSRPRGLGAASQNSYLDPTNHRRTQIRLCIYFLFLIAGRKTVHLGATKYFSPYQ